MAKQMVKFLSKGMVFLLLIGVIWTLLLSFFAFYRYPNLFPRGFTDRYWSQMLFDNPLFKQALLMSLWTGALCGLVSTVIGFMSAYGIVQMGLEKSGPMVLVYSLPLLVPVTALFIGVHMVMLRLGLNNTLVGVVMAHALMGIPYATNIGISFFKGIPRQMVAVSRTLGAGRFFVFKKVILPLIMPGVTLSFALCFVLSVSDYFAVFLIGGGKIITLTSVYYPFLVHADYGHSSVLSLIFILTNVLVFYGVHFMTKKHFHVGAYLYD